MTLAKIADIIVKLWAVHSFNQKLNRNPAPMWTRVSMPSPPETPLANASAVQASVSL